MRKLMLIAASAAFFSMGMVACTGDDDDDDDDAGAVPVSGIVAGINGQTVIEGATVTAVGEGESDTTDAAGQFSLLLASNLEVTIRASNTGNYSGQTRIVVPAGGTDEISFGLPTDAEIAGIVGAVGGTPDTSAGTIVVEIGTSSTAGGFTASISAANDGSFTFSSSGNPVLSSTTLPNGETFLGFFNVTAGTTTVTLTPPGGISCTKTFPSVTDYPVDAATYTAVRFECTP